MSSSETPHDARNVLPLPEVNDMSSPGEAAVPDQASRTKNQDKRVKSLEATVAKLQSQVTETESRLAKVREELSAITSDDPSMTVKRHIRLLHDYNEVKDIGQGLMGLIADARGVRHVEVQAEFGVGKND